MTGIRLQQRVATRERILATARQLFLKAEFEQVGVREIATEAGVATGTVIAAFGSKGELLNAIVVEDLLVQLTLMKAAAGKSETTIERLMAICNACVAHNVKQLVIVRAIMADAWTRSDEAETRVRAVLKPIVSFLASELERGILRGEVQVGTDCKMCANMIFETVVNSYRIAIYSERAKGDLVPIIVARLGLLLKAVLIFKDAGQENAALASLGVVAT